MRFTVTCTNFFAIARWTHEISLTRKSRLSSAISLAAPQAGLYRRIARSSLETMKDSANRWASPQWTQFLRLLCVASGLDLPADQGLLCCARFPKGPQIRVRLIRLSALLIPIRRQASTLWS